MIDKLSEVLESTRILRSDILPSYWNEQHRSMPSGSAFPGKFSYDKTPYTREIADRAAPTDPAKFITLMKGAQAGGSTGVIEAIIGWIISESPGHILMLTGHSDLSDEAMNKIDLMIDSCGLRHLIKPNVLRAKNSRTGDTNKSKEFPLGSLIAGSATNHKLLRQRSCKYGFIDDFDAAPIAAKGSGSTSSMIEQRFAAYYDVMKLFYISSPELKNASNIEIEYLKGDQRKYHIPCQCCGVPIPLVWEMEIPGTDGKEKAGITWKLDSSGRPIKSSIGYVCQECGGFFTDKNKYEFNLAGHWVPTAEPIDEYHTSYHLSSLYAPAGMYDWEHYIKKYLEACPPGKPRIERYYKTFVNVALAQTYEETGESPKANQIQKNTRNYEIAAIPEKLSINDGNGEIIMLTCSADMNGVIDDARLDYEIVAWAESGSSYSIMHGSIGTFIPRENARKEKVDREHWTYEENKPNSVWPEFDKVLQTVFETDSGRKMQILISGLDCGHYTTHAYGYIDRTNNFVIGLKGSKEDSTIRFGVDVAYFKPALERSKLYILQVGLIKDYLSDCMNLKWRPHNEEAQPSGYMNFPQPSKGLYGFENYFEHYESEHRVVEASADGKHIAARWVKKNAAVQNHMWDCRVYNIAVKEIFVAHVGKERKDKTFTWKDLADLIMGRVK